jgi:molecular chaperone GrpE
VTDAHETPDPEPAVEDGAMAPVSTAGTDEEEVQVAPVDEAVEEAEAILEGDLDSLMRERDEFRQIAQQLQADFENYRKRVLRQQTEHLERASEGLVEKLLPVLDACDAAIAHGAADVEPVAGALLAVLEKEGLERVGGIGAVFDPNVHEAVMHEEGEGEGEPEVVEVLRTGYLFKGRVLRPAMVKVAG